MRRWGRIMKVLPLALLLSLIMACTPRPCPVAAPVPPPAPPAAKPDVVKDVDPSGLWRIQWDRGPTGWWPRDFTGKLRIARDGDGWTARVRFNQSGAGFTLKKVTVKGDRLHITFIGDKDKATIDLAGFMREDRLVGEVRWGTAISWSPFWARRMSVKPLTDATAKDGLPPGDLSKAGLETATLALLKQRADEENSSALVVVKDGKVLVERYRDGDTGPVNAMSVSKSVVALAVGQLIQAGKFNLETKLSRLIKGWPRKGAKAKITIWHLLNHTSGLDTKRAGDQEDILKRGLASEVKFAPGTRFQYNNNAVDLLAAVVKVVSGEQLDAYLDKHLFKPTLSA